VLIASTAYGQSAASNPGQSTASKPAFASATVTPYVVPDPTKMIAEIRAGKRPATIKFGPHVDTAQAEYDMLTLQDLIGIAYGEQTVQIRGPDWL